MRKEKREKRKEHGKGEKKKKALTFNVFFFSTAKCKIELQQTQLFTLPT